VKLAQIVYLLAGLTSLLCAFLLLRGYWLGRKRLLLWSGLCFGGLGLTNTMVFFDLVVLPQIDLFPYRLITAAVSMAFLLYGLIWESQ
jgi:hypothetical protein